MRFPRRLLAAAAALALVAAGCGSDEPRQTVTVTNPVASTPAATSPPAGATEPGTTATTPRTRTRTQPRTRTRTTAPAPESDGGEQRIRVPATYTVASGRLNPALITVPQFLAVEVAVRSADGGAHRLVLRTPQPHTLDVPAGGRASVRLAGLPPGAYRVELDGRPAGLLAVGGEVGP